MFWPNCASDAPGARVPPATGRSIRIEFRRAVFDHVGNAAHAATFIRERRIVFDADLKRQPSEFPRIFAHEVFHFVWARLGNGRRRSYERIVAAELRGRVRGELGWSAESRKRKLSARDRTRRTRRWREYCCESFCDTAAWIYSGNRRHSEHTLSTSARRQRREWFRRSGLDAEIAI